jgi:hypothetical protein
LSSADVVNAGENQLSEVRAINTWGSASLRTVDGNNLDYRSTKDWSGAAYAATKEYATEHPDEIKDHADFNGRMNDVMLATAPQYGLNYSVVRATGYESADPEERLRAWFHDQSALAVDSPRSDDPAEERLRAWFHDRSAAGKISKGEAEGHPFRGNQYEEGESGPEERHFNLGGVPISKVPRNYVMGAGYSEQSEKSEPYYASNIKGCYTFDVGTGEANDPLRSGQIVLPPPAAEPVLRGSVEWDAYMATWSRVTFGNTVGRSGNLAYRMMDSAIARSTTTRDTVLYRGIAVSDASQYGVGATFRDMGYTSVTRDPALAEQFAELRATGSAEHLGTGLFDENRVLAGGEKIVFAIHVPAGSSTMAGDDSVKEFILPRGGTYTVTSYDPGTGLTHVDYKP